MQALRAQSDLLVSNNQVDELRDKIKELTVVINERDDEIRSLRNLTEAQKADLAKVDK